MPAPRVRSHPLHAVKGVLCARARALVRTAFAATGLLAFASYSAPADSDHTSQTTAVSAEPASAVRAPPAPQVPRNSPGVGPDGGQARRMNRITVAPLALFIISPAVEYERALGDKASWFLGAQLSLLGAVTQFLGGDSTIGPILFLGVRCFPDVGALAPKGVWVGPAAWGWFTQHSSQPPQLVAVGLRAAAGYTFIETNGFTFSAGSALGAEVVTKPPDPTVPPTVTVRPNLGVHLNVGYAF